MSQFFVDRVEIKIRGGNGGSGCVSFRREKFVPKGGPDGGDGGDGGSVIFEATRNEQSLIALRYMPHYEADNGQHGMGSQCHGKRGADIVVPVPVGTVIKEILPDGERRLLVDLDDIGQRFIAAKGGRGGRGNLRFVSSVNRAPRRSDPGTPGEEVELELELKIIAHIGLVGYPNAGKSTFLGATTNADPETGAYPFTTVTPHVGMVEYEDFARLMIADIPGLVLGAHRNVGLGHDFLRHIERTHALAYVLDMAGTDDRDPLQDLVDLQFELEAYQEGLSKRPAIIIANKMDEAGAAENLERLRAVASLDIYPVCAVLGQGTKDVLDAFRRLVPVKAV